MTPMVKQWPDDSMERRAYDSVKSVPVLEENDRNRLGYNIFLYLRGELPSIEEALHVAQPRMHCSQVEAAHIIATALATSPESEA